MKKHVASLLIMLFAQHFYASTFYEQLCAFNFNWKKYKSLAPAGDARNFNSDKEYVQAHLSCVIPILKANAVGHLTKEQYNRRMQLIEMLDDYRIAGNFPINYYRRKRVPVFIDEHNTHCAVAYLLQQTGYEDLARDIATANNYAWVKDIKNTDLLNWQKFSGLSLEELKLIQGAYDFYRHDAFILPNKHEIPQKPACMIAYFDDYSADSAGGFTKNIWCYGEGKNGVLHGRWEQNYAIGLPWIIGYFENGKRSGQWKEYYQGTKQLCRTENWRNDKLNGVRKRFDRSGFLIEEILFKDGNAITKTNYDLHDSLVWIRKPLDSVNVYTQVFTFGGSLLAAGHEKIYNPGNLLWFQNIELTALNSAAISARSETVLEKAGINGFIPRFSQQRLYNTPALVEYKKEGDWMYYKEYTANKTTEKPSNSLKDILDRAYRHFCEPLFKSIAFYNELSINSGFDSIRVEYKNDLIQHFYAHGNDDYVHLQFSYYDFSMIKDLGQYNKNREKIGVWKHYLPDGALYKTENYIFPWKEQEEEIQLTSLKK